MDDNLVNLQQILPEIHVPQKRLMEPLSRIEYIAWLSRFAMDVQSSVHLSTVLRLITTVQQTELLKQASNGQLAPEVEAAYGRLTAQYTAIMEAIPQQVAAQLLDELQKVPADMHNRGFLAKLRDLLSE